MLDYNNLLSSKVMQIKPSGIRRFFDLAQQMEGVISLGVGEPDFKTPLKVREAAIKSLEAGDTKYTANAGMVKLKEEIANYIERRFSLHYNPTDEIFVTVGGSEAIDICIRAIVNPGDEVMVVTPSYVCYSPMAELAHATVVALPTFAKDHFALTAETLKNAITPKTKLLILPFPSNPTGGVMGEKQLAEIAKVLEGTNILVLADEIYAELTYDSNHLSIASLPGMRERTVVVNGFSKSHSMTGWRLGYTFGPKEILAQMLKIHQYAIMCAPTMSQYAGIEALKSCDIDVAEMRAEYKERRDFLVAALNRIGLECHTPQGAFYLFPSIQSTGLTSEEFCAQLLHSQKVAVIPGNAFGESGEGYVRISYSYSVAHLKEAVARIERFLKELKNTI